MTNKIRPSRLASLTRCSARGQTMVIVGLLLGLGVLIGLVAIAFDGGSALLQRRTMQNGAEAGALAGITLMGNNLAASCSPLPCHPTYLITNTLVLNQVDTLVQANRGGTVGATAANYSTLVEYHIMDADGVANRNTYQPVPANPSTTFVPHFVDGIRVTAIISNPTTFGGALPVAIDNIQVSAQAASRLYPTCAPAPTGSDGTLPFTRFRPALEAEILVQGNDLCQPYRFWTSGGDITGGNGFRNLISLNTKTMYPSQFGNNTDQLLTQWDQRNGISGGLGNYVQSGNPPYQNCAPGSPGNCADMRGSRLDSGNQATQDVQNWLFWQWAGRITTAESITRTYPVNSETWYPSTEATAWGRNGGTERPGDWAELYSSGNWGQNVQEALHDAAADPNRGSITPLSGAPLNWGRAITRTVYLYGDAVVPSSTSSQFVRNYSPPCPGGPPCPANEYHWEDTTISGTYGGCGSPPCYQANNQIQRVRFTKARTIVFYANLQGNYGARGPGGCSLPSSGSSAWGILPSVYVPGPSGETCSTGWQPGGGAYSRQVEP